MGYTVALTIHKEINAFYEKAASGAFIELSLSIEGWV